MSAQPENRVPRPLGETCSDAIVVDFIEVGKEDRTVRPRHPGVKIPEHWREKDVPKAPEAPPS